MREYKFRGMSINGSWYHGQLAVLKKDINPVVKAGSYISNSVGMPFAYPVRPDTVGMLTGLKDKAFGKEVYDGDLCTATFKSKGGGVINLTGKIVWDDFMWCLETEDDFFSLNRVTIIEVTGNIYETKVPA